MKDSFVASGSGHTQIAPAQPPIKDSKEEARKECTKCGQQKPFSEFYRKRDDYESFCKSCKKKHRIKADESSPYVDLGSPQIVENRPQFPHIEPESSSPKPREPVCFLHWEKRYGRKLSEEEELDILTNFTSFFKWLMEEEKNEHSKKGK